VLRKIAEFDTGHNGFEFSAIPDRSGAVYRDGDYMSFQVYSAEDCFFLVQVIQVDGQVKDVYPTRNNQNNRLKAGVVRTLPDGTRFRLGEPFGEEYILVSAFKEQIAVTNESVDLASANFVTRGIEVEDDQAKTGGSISYNRSIKPAARAKFSYTVLPR